MANVKDPPVFLTQLKKALVDTLQANGLKATVKSTRVPTTKLYRLSVRSPQFKAMTPSERQNLVWRIADRAISRDNQMRISMILTLTDDEAKGK